MQEESAITRTPVFNTRILLAESDEGSAEVLKRLLRSQNCRVLECASARAFTEIFPSRRWDAVIFNYDLYAELAESGVIERLSIPSLLLADYSSLDAARVLVESGEATACLSRPFRAEQLLRVLGGILAERPAVAGDGESGEVSAASQRHPGGMVGESAPMQELYRQIGRVGASDMTVLILGESGTGKELVARAIHEAGAGAERPFIPVNCASLPENLLESELFGHLKGAFTGAVRNKDGLFLAADGGTLFLDEIGSVPHSTQVALLRALQEKRIRPVGATHDIPVNVRVVAATNEDVTALRDSGRLRPDLYYRLSAFIISVPPLRERNGDLPLLERAFLEEFTPDGKAVPVLDSGASMALAAHSWPGNVRELRHAIERGVTLCENGVVRAADLPPEICGSGGVPGMPQPPEDVGQMTLKAYLRMCERHYLEWVLRENDGDKDKCARILGISVATLYRKLAE